MAKTTKPKRTVTRPFKTDTREIKVKRTYVKLDGKEFEFYDLYETVEALENTTYGGNVLVIHNDDLEAALIKRKVFEKFIRGSGARGPGYDAFRARLDKTMDALQSR